MNSILEKFKNPIISGLVAGIIGVIVGLLWGWVVQPVVWTDTAPDILRADYQQEYLRMAVDSYTVNGNDALAYDRWQAVGANAPAIMDEIQKSPNMQDQNAIKSFAILMNAKDNANGVISGKDAAAEKPGMSAGLKYLLIAIAVIVVAAVGVFAFRLLRPMSGSQRGVATPAQQAQQFNKSAEHTDFSKLGLATPITQSMTSYVLGDDLYDESFSIDSQAGEFMGEFGVGISETIGVGDPKKVTALEIWLFDKNDIKTATKVLMTEHAYNDANIRQKLEAKGELVLVEPKKQVVLETATLQLLVTIADLEYGAGPLPPNSYIERATLELAVWPKEQ
ncbi:MAG: hypothetical protein L3J16_06405 [Anaerolineales bacterium]|nr:hypothetical protein [Anaerolineales bacterium]